ncbi:polysaccharide deacetylase family protein [Streptococcus caballi]|uniref:polysaccharide deacetylase family protein n=1 Tax=Streptococcus caballi TaxID=439220 RepID=UPI000376E542|nr:polysaccharide deacetylase family protein [Streptococcus caballi]
MEKRSQRSERKHHKSFKVLNITLLLACLLALVFLSFMLVDKKIISLTNQKRTVNSQSKVTSTKKVEKTTNNSQPKTQETNWVKQENPVKVPILMYHAIHDMAPEEAGNANLIVSPSVFETHIKRLVDEGYYFLTPEETYKVLTDNVLPNGNNKIIWLTFDDSLWDFYDKAFPILKQYKTKATNNVITGTVGNSGNLTLDQMKEMKQSGMSFESHTVNHPDLEYSSQEKQIAELSDSDRYLDSNLAQDTIAVAYPAGRYSDTTLNLAANNYKLGVTTNEGVATAADGLLSLKRVRILPTTDADTLISTISQ